MEYIKNIVVIGTGNVGHHLVHGLFDTKIKIKGIWSRTSQNAKTIAQSLNCPVISSIESINSSVADLVLISVVDDAIETILSQLDVDIPVAYTSGSVRLDQLPKRKKIGVFYPLQTFSKKRSIDLSDIPFLIEASDPSFAEELFGLAQKLSSNVSYADSNDRYQLHIAAVMVNNFTNHLFSLAKEHLDKNHIDFELLKPLLKETVYKLDELNPSEAQTGPAKRGDIEVIEKHLSSLAGRTKEIYRLLSDSILEMYK